MEYDERYGSILCATSLLEPIFLPIGWTLYVFDSNEVICRILYLPVAGVITAALGVANFVSAPFLLLLKASMIFSSVLEQTSVKKAAIKFAELIVFIAAALLIFTFHSLLDPIIFFANLFSYQNE
jgi:hypothetical protein